MKREKIVQTAGRLALNDFAPHFARYNDDILFGEVWNDETLTPKERSMIVLSVFMGRGLMDSSLDHHLKFARENGLSKEEFSALVTHAAFYAGWPTGWGLFNRAKEIYKAPMSLEEFAKTIDYPIGQPNDAYAQYFSKRSWLAPLTNGNLSMANVTFEPGCKNNWHIHHASLLGGQTLICVGGHGWYQEWGKEPVEMTKGTIIEIPANVKHWHGAAEDSWFAHIAISNPGENTSTEWLEAVK